MSWLEQIAPTIATAVAGPLGGLAYEAIAKVLGVSADDAKSVIESGKLNAEQVAAIQQAELQLKARAQEMGLDFAKLTVDDRKSARDMQAATRSIVPAVLAFLITGGFFGILAALMSGQVTKSDELMVMLGALGTSWTGVIAFYFGSSASSQNKDQLLYNSAPTK